MYFDTFPVIPYDSVGNYYFKNVTNLLRRVGLRSKIKLNTLSFDTYDVKGGETPEIIAHKLYGDPELHWIIMIVNDITDIGSDNTNYPSATAITNYEYEEKEQDKRRQIRLLDPKFIDRFISEFNTLMNESVI